MSPTSQDNTPSVEIKAPNPIPFHNGNPTIFLAGSIEMGEAEDWQTYFAKNIYGCNVLNPRRDDWDSSWVQSIDNPQFREQVEWELKGLRASDFVAINFCAGLMAPITLLEFGIMTTRRPWQSVAVHCPEGFWRKGNVDIVCAWHDIPTFDSLDDLIWYSQSKLEKAND